MESQSEIIDIDVWQVHIPLAQPYHLSKVYGTLTSSEVAIVRLNLGNDIYGWGEADPGGLNFDGSTIESVIDELRKRAPDLLGQCVLAWVQEKKGEQYHGAAAAAIDVACYDALGRLKNIPVYQLLGSQRHHHIPSLWPTSSGSAESDLENIYKYYAKGFRTYMLKMGDSPIDEDISRVKEVISKLTDDVKIMADANQGWERQEALAFVQQTASLPLVLVEQPVLASDHEGLRLVREASNCPISVDESLWNPDDVSTLLDADAADAFSIKISKNGGLANSKKIASMVRMADKKVLMNSMIELGITQAASLHLACTLDNLVDCGHAYMSTLRMADDISDFSSLIREGTAYLPNAPGLGINVSLQKIQQYQVGHFNVC